MAASKSPCLKYLFSCWLSRSNFVCGGAKTVWIANFGPWGGRETSTATSLNPLTKLWSSKFSLCPCSLVQKNLYVQTFPLQPLNYPHRCSINEPHPFTWTGGGKGRITIVKVSDGIKKTIEWNVKLQNWKSREHLKM